MDSNLFHLFIILQTEKKKSENNGLYIAFPAEKSYSNACSV